MTKRKHSSPPANPAELPLLDPNRLYKPRNAAPYLDVSVVYLYRLIKEGRIKTVDVGGLKIPGSEIVRVGTPPEPAFRSVYEDRGVIHIGD